MGKKRIKIRKKTPVSYYCGSLIQQSFQEEPAHGFLLWDVETKNAKFHAVENDYGFKVIEVMDGKIQNKMKYVPPKGNIKIKYWDTSLDQIKDIQIGLRKQFPKLKELKVERQDTISKMNGGTLNKINIGDVRDTTYQNELISEYLSSNIDNIDKDTISRICSLNDMTNNSPEIYDGDVTRNVDWKVKSFEFDNMFSYGSNNKIDFSKFNGSVGIVAPNHSGKSALIDAISYTIFDTCSRTSKALDVLNKKQKIFIAKLNLEINGQDYWIERDGKYKSRNHRDGTVTEMCPVNVKFYTYDDSGEKIDLSGAARSNSQYGSGTNEEIRKILGTFDDFILTSLSLQTNGMNFIDKKQSDRKKILSQFMDIDIFDQLYDIAKSDSNDERLILKQLKKNDSYRELSNIESKITEYTNEESKYSNDEIKIDNSISNIEITKSKLLRKLNDVDNNDIDIDDINLKLIQLEIDISSITHQLVDDTEYKETLRPLYMKYHTQLNGIDEDKLIKDYNLYIQLLDDKSKLDHDINLISSRIDSLKSHLLDLDKYEYDPNCEFCLNNGEKQIDDRKVSVDKLSSLDDELGGYNTKLESIIESIENLHDIDNNKKEYDIFIDELDRIEKDVTRAANKIKTNEITLMHLKSEKSSLNDKILQYNKNSNIIQMNNDLNNEINKLESELTILLSNKKEVNNKRTHALTNLHVFINEKQRIEGNIKNLVDIEQKIYDYDLYLMSLSKDGVPYELISRTLPAIEREINLVLENMMVSFTIQLEMKEKNIDSFICYGDDRWNLELSSGMERFVSSLAIRIGLINVSTLPRPNFLVVDEGFGSLDGDNIANMEGAFNYMRDQFDFIMIITHLDTIKDYMDVLLPIEVINGYSKINFY